MVAPTVAEVSVKARGGKHTLLAGQGEDRDDGHAMIAIEKKIGRPTRLVASSTISSTPGRLFVFTPHRVPNAFSMTTIAAFTNTPMAMAAPASDMMLELISR